MAAPRLWADVLSGLGRARLMFFRPVLSSNVRQERERERGQAFRSPATLLQSHQDPPAEVTVAPHIDVQSSARQMFQSKQWNTLLTDVKECSFYLTLCIFTHTLVHVMPANTPHLLCVLHLDHKQPDMFTLT